MNFYLLKYNNYYNRIVKKFEALGDYLQEPYYNNINILNVNFNENDGVNTTQIINSNAQGDYAIVTDNINNIETIVSRWFVLEHRRQRNGQWLLTLRRDLVADNYNTIINAPAFIEKATVNANDPAIFNKENMTFNQIKTSETLIKDETGSAWVVGYIPRDSFSEAKKIKGTAVLDNAYDILVDNINNWEYYKYVNNQTFIGCVDSINIYGDILAYYDEFGAKKALVEVGANKSGIISNGRLIYNYSGVDLSLRLVTTANNNFVFDNSLALQGVLPQLRNTVPKNWVTNYDDILTAFNTWIGYKSQEDTDSIKSLDGQVIYDTSSNMYWRIRVENDIYGTTIGVNQGTKLCNTLDDLLIKTIGGYTIIGEPNGYTFLIEYKSNNIKLYLEQITQEANVTIDNNRYHLEDQPYDMFCIPYSDDLKIYKNGNLLVTANKSLAVNIATEIGADTGTANIYDIQLLPYCPVRYMIKDNGEFDIGNAYVHYIKDSDNNNIGVICWATSSSFTLDINYNINVDDYKISNECDIYRLVSPNYNGQFEFSVAMNNGVALFNIDCSYKPFNPYIHINPNFNRLFGKDFNDARGLICQGDFSLPQISNAWANYELTNKNYQNIFNREIQSMEISNKYQNIQQLASAGASALSTGVSAGMILGPIGGVIAGGLSLAGAGADYAINKALQNEALDYKKDMYGYQLGNIQALPTSLTKTSAFTYNNKIFPILEYYTCTPEEKQALRDKIKYNGMTVGRIGKMVDFLQEDYSYIKAQLIRLELDNDTNYLNEIANEVNKGVFIK